MSTAENFIVQSIARSGCLLVKFPFTYNLYSRFAVTSAISDSELDNRQALRLFELVLDRIIIYVE